MATMMAQQQQPMGGMPQQPPQQPAAQQAPQQQAPPAPQGQQGQPGMSPSIYVGDLDQKVTEAMLYEHFRVIGPVVSVRVCIDSQTHKSLGYGYVNFQNPADAERAIEQMNGTRLNDRPCRVSRIQRDPTQRKSGVTNIVIKNLPSAMDGTSLKEIFAKFGKIVSIKVPTNEDGAHRGYAYLMFDKEEAARQAVDEMHNAEVGEGVKLTVERYKNPAAVREEAMKQFTNLYVKNLAPGVTDEQLNAAFAKYGEITSAKVRMDENGQPMGFGFVAFADHEAAVEAVEAYNEKEGTELAPEGQVLTVKRFMDKKERNRAREQAYRERQAQYAKYPNLYIKNFDDNVTEQQLRDLFEQFGETVSVRIQHDPFTKISRGFGFVSFKEHQAADKAVRELAGSRVLGMRPLFVTYAMRRDARRQQFEDLQKKRMPRPMGMGGPMGPGMGPMGGMGGMGGPGGNNMFGQQQFRMMQPMGGMGGGMQGMMMRPGMGGGMGPQGPMGMQNPMMNRGPGGMGGPMGPGGMGPMGGMGGMGGPARPPMQPQPKPAQQQHPSGLDANYLASMSPEQQKNVLGERLYNYIVKKFPRQAAKITGMLLEMDNSEILNLLDSPQQLEAKMNEAMEVLEKHDNSSRM